MIARIWHGRTPADKVNEYVEYVKKTGVESLSATPGNKGDFIFTRIEGDVAHFLVLSLWESMEAVKKFAGPEPEKPVYYPEDDKFLLELEPGIEHYDVPVSPIST
jgi:heme-degrading monooxygenase HmoA